MNPNNNNNNNNPNVPNMNAGIGAPGAGGFPQGMNAMQMIQNMFQNPPNAPNVGGFPGVPGAQQVPNQQANMMQAMMQALLAQPGAAAPAAAQPFIMPLTPEQMNGQNVPQDIQELTLDVVARALSHEDYAELFVASIALFQYAGFNPESTFDALKKYAGASGVSRTQFMRDVVDLLAYYMARGTTIQKRGAINSTTQDAIRRVNILIQRYRIQDNVFTNAKGPNIVTLGRIMNTFPEIIGEKLALRVAKVVGQKKIVPRCISFAGGAALIPRLPGFDGLYQKYLDYQVTFSRTINRLRRQAAQQAFDPVRAREEADMWADLARQNSRHSDEFRIIFLQKYSIDFVMTWQRNPANVIIGLNMADFVARDDDDERDPSVHPDPYAELDLDAADLHAPTDELLLAQAQARAAARAAQQQQQGNA